MKLLKIELSNVRSFKGLWSINPSKKINIIIGQNNSGKSTVLKSLLSTQARELTKNDITKGENTGFAKLTFDEIPWINKSLDPTLLLELKSSTSLTADSQEFTTPSDQLKDCIFIPHLSNRKNITFSNEVNTKLAKHISGTYSNLYARIESLSNNHTGPKKEMFIRACRDILGFEISTSMMDNGKVASYKLKDDEYISIKSMGEGIVSMLGIICDLCLAENKIFLLEEIENDIHPKALKSLLAFIQERSEVNQIFISTHSNIVLRNLVGKDNKLFHIESIEKGASHEYPTMTTSSIKEVTETIERAEILEDLGYEVSDYLSYKAWILLEESSAEVFIRDFFFRWFTPSLIGKVRTYSCGSLSQVERRFNDFIKLFAFINMEPTYKDKAWVIIDAGQNEDLEIEKLRKIYSTWNPEQFLQFNKHDFEEYYPTQFKKEVDEILNFDKGEKNEGNAKKRKQQKRLLKITLTNRVKDWVSKNEETARAAFEESAAPVIAILKQIEAKLK